MTTIVINDSSPQGRLLVNMMREAKKTTRAIVSIEDEDLDLAYGPIPGLAYTKEERIASVRKSMAEYRAGVKGYTTDELRARIERSEEDYSAGRLTTSNNLRAKHQGV